MSTILTWQAVALRLALTALSAGILGFDRDEQGHPAGLRTNLLVGLAACLAMLQANWLLNSNGRPGNSFVMMDVLRFPLGILSGIGFIGAGAILKRGDLAVGVTTAATIWFVTVMGLCFGGGQVELGLAGFVLGFVILTGVKKIELRLPRRHTARLRVDVSSDGPTQAEIAALLNRGGLSTKEPTLSIESRSNQDRVYGWVVEWKGPHDETKLPDVIQQLTADQAVQKLELTR